MSREELLIPCALSEEGRIVHAHEGFKGHFRCPGCLESVLWRHCDDVERRSHFAHEPGSPCTESQFHSSAKRLVAQQVNDWRRGRGRRPVYFAPCIQCGKKLEPVEIPGHATTDATVEHRLPSGRVPDVWCGFAIEIFYRHAIDDDKIDIFREDNVDWIELDAEPVLEDPSRWVFRRGSGWFKEIRRCVTCISTMRKEAETQRDDGWKRHQWLRKQEQELRESKKALDVRSDEITRRTYEVSARENGDRVTSLQAQEKLLSEQLSAMRKAIGTLEGRGRALQVAVQENETKLKLTAQQVKQKFWSLSPAQEAFLERIVKEKS